MVVFLKRKGYSVNRKRMQRLMRKLGLAVMDWYSRNLLSWRVSNTLDAGFCVNCPETALRAR